MGRVHHSDYLAAATSYSAMPDPRRPLLPAFRSTPVYRPDDAPIDYARDLGDPGQFPFTRGVQATMYRGRLWTMRQYAGFGTAAETNRRFQHLLAAGQTGPERRVRSADPDGHRLRFAARAGRSRSRGRRDRHASRTCTRCSTDIPLDKVSTSMTINATASTLLAMYIVVAEERGIARDPAERHDPERHPEGVHRARHVHLSARAQPERSSPTSFASARRTCRIGIRSRSLDTTFAKPARRRYRSSRSPLRTRSNTCRARSTAGLSVDTFAPRLSFFFASHNDVFEEVAKFRAARRMYARIMRERFGAGDASCRLRFHTQTGGVTLQAQQPLNNVVRVGMQALAAVLGGTQSLHTNGYDEALALPTAEAATLALRTQQIVAYESGAALTVDPLAGSYYVEALTSELERQRHRAARARRRVGRRRQGDRGVVLPGRDRAQRVRASASRRAR